MGKLNGAEWARKFKAFLKNNFNVLRPQISELSANAKGAGFELQPRPSFVHNVYIECRWEAAGKVSDVGRHERSDARIVIQLQKEHGERAVEICEVLSAAKSGDLVVRVADSDNTIYVSKKLPPLDVARLPSEQRETSLQYGNACVELQEFWRMHHARLG